MLKKLKIRIYQVDYKYVTNFVDNNIQKTTKNTCKTRRLFSNKQLYLRDNLCTFIILPVKLFS